MLRNDLIILLFFQRRVADLPLAATQQSNGTRIGEGIVTAMRMVMARTMFYIELM